MPACIRCRKEMQEATPFCPWCGAKQERSKGRKARGNGTGTAYKRGRSWTAKVIVGWRVDESGKSFPVTRTRSGFKTKTDALEACRELIFRSTAPPSSITFAALYDQWAEKYSERVTRSTMDCYRAAYKHCRDIQYLRFVDIKGDDLQGCIDRCSAGKRTKENIKAMLSLVYKYAMHNDLVDRNRAETLYTGDQPKGTRPSFTRAELERIREAVGVEPYADYVYSMCYLGYRPGEMLALKKSAYDAAHDCLIGGSKTDAGRDRIVTISPKVKSILDERLIMPGEYIFPRLDTGKRMSPAYFRDECFYPLMKQLGIEGRVPYSCRHTFSNLLKDVQGSDTDKSALMGHSDTSMTKEYQSADYESLRALTDRI